MVMSVLTNIMSLNAQQNLSTTQSKLATAIQRLSSGMRINSAKDDAAGLAIATRFTTQINGLNQAVRNANDGISLAQTTESALNEVTNNMQRIRELAVQSANATNSDSDRAALDAEVQQRLAEITRIASQTSFNGRHVLDGTFGQAAFQVGANVGETISVNLSQGSRADQLGQIATSTSGAVTGNALTNGGVTIAVGSGAAVSIGASTAGGGAGQTASSAFAKAAAINASGVAGLTATASNSVTGAFTSTGGAAGNTYTLSINGVSIYNGTDTSGAALTGSAVAAQVNLYSTQTGVSASFTGGNLTFSTSDGRDINIAQTLGGGATGGVAAGVVKNNQGTVTLSAADNITMTGAYADLGFASNTITKDTNTLASTSVKTVAGANDTMNRIDAALATISSMRSNLGAVQNRFQSTIANLQTISQNLDASRSQIQDADFAAETANMSSANILQQAGVSVLAQANSSTQSVLKLLQ
ncbi:MAG TPA: flagellin [Frateuria sp.]|uniref:flagellin N-terminal helical domain-containing protein n=1 Tax=Frateuria sp. TaxID=2211372 RepID=UPI002DF6F508|nr:flagellin [Frateuria sp.]